MFQVGGVQSTDPAYYVSVVFIFTNVLINPFIYAAKHDDVKNQLSSWLRCKKVDNIQLTNGGNTREITETSHM